MLKGQILQELFIRGTLSPAVGVHHRLVPREGEQLEKEQVSDVGFDGLAGDLHRFSGLIYDEKERMQI